MQASKWKNILINIKYILCGKYKYKRKKQQHNKICVELQMLLFNIAEQSQASIISRKGIYMRGWSEGPPPKQLPKRVIRKRSA